MVSRLLARWLWVRVLSGRFLTFCSAHHQRGLTALGEGRPPPIFLHPRSRHDVWMGARGELSLCRNKGQSVGEGNTRLWAKTGWGPENEDFGPENEALQVRTLD